MIEEFSALPLGNRAVAGDVLDNAYEYLIKKFADATSKKAGEFYTPRPLVGLMADTLDRRRLSEMDLVEAVIGLALNLFYGTGLAACILVLRRAKPPERRDIDEIVRVVRFPGWQQTSAGEREVRKALRKALFKYRLHRDTGLFDGAYRYVETYY